MKCQTTCVANRNSLETIMEHEEFDEFWGEVEALAKELGVTVRYVEEEFVLEGELIKP